jgi:chemotaxis protein CheX
MSITAEQKNRAIKELLNGAYESMKTIIPLEHQVSKPNLINGAVQLEFGVLVGITGDIKGQIILEGEANLFGGLGLSMFGMPLEGEMLNSFSGELGNMIAGQLSTIVSTKEINIDITSPTIVYGDVRLSGYQHVIQITATFEELGEMDIYLLLQ